jgi:hypothetical protein
VAELAHDVAQPTFVDRPALRYLTSIKVPPTKSMPKLKPLMAISATATAIAETEKMTIGRIQPMKSKFGRVGKNSIRSSASRGLRRRRNPSARA